MQTTRVPVNPVDRHIGLRVLARREILRMSVTEAAARLGVSEPVLAEFETGELRIDLDTMFRMTVLLGVRPRYFFQGLGGAASGAAHAQAG